jgi:hypothetical protein
MNTRVLSVLAASLLAVSTPAFAHHSAAQFDLSNHNMYWTGVVKEFKPINPHAVVTIEVTDEKGTRAITFEGRSMSNMYRNGWRPGKVNVGDTVTINAAPRKDGADGGFVFSIQTKDGGKY